MRGWTERKIIPVEAMRLYRAAEMLVDALPMWRNVEGSWVPCAERYTDGTEVRCHELIRAVTASIAQAILKPLSWKIHDGTYGAVDHSWLEFYVIGYGMPFVLDVYVPGRVPMVQLVDGTGLLPEYRLYQKGLGRDDLQFDLIEAMTKWLLRNRPPGALAPNK